MTRNSEGTVVPQCEATYENEGRFVHCIMERGHSEPHCDARGNWGRNGEDEEEG